MEKATEELDKRTAALEKLNTEKIELSKKIETLRIERAAAVKAIAGGDERQARIISDIEAKIAPLALRFEGIDQLIADAKTAANKAKAALEQAMAEEEARLSAFIAAKDQEEYAALIASLPQREQKIIDLHHQLCISLAELQIDMHRFTQGGKVDQVGQIQELLPTFPMKIRASIEKNGLRPLFRREAFQDIVIWPLTNALPGRGPIAPGEVAEMRRAQHVQKLTVEFKSLNN